MRRRHSWRLQSLFVARAALPDACSWQHVDRARAGLLPAALCAPFLPAIHAEELPTLAVLAAPLAPTTPTRGSFGGGDGSHFPASNGALASAHLLMGGKGTTSQYT